VFLYKFLPLLDIDVYAETVDAMLPHKTKMKLKGLHIKAITAKPTVKM
jgi:hypothetical protein